MNNAVLEDIRMETQPVASRQADGPLRRFAMSNRASISERDNPNTAPLR